MKVLSGVGLGLVLLAAISAGAKERAPNFVFFLVDDLGWTDLGCYRVTASGDAERDARGGSDYYETPHIDALAAEGVRFTNAYAACNACSPTRAAVLTGMYPARLRLTDWIPGQKSKPVHRLRAPDWTQRLEHRHVTIAEALRERGYATAHVGKWHLGGKEFFPTRQGFDVNIGGSRIGAPGSYYYPYYRKPGAASGPVENLPEGGPEGRYLTDRLADEAVKLIEGWGEDPFFLYFAFYSVHTPIQPREDLRERYEAKAAGERHTNASYAAMVGAVDEAVGRVVSQLEGSRRSEDTVIVFTSDNGGMHKVTSNAPLRGGKGMAWEGGTRVPLIVRWPGVTAEGVECGEPVSSVDFFPTLVEMAGGVAEEVDGVSLVPLLRDAGAGLGRETLFWHYPHYNVLLGVPHGIVREGRWKLIEFFEDGHVELYDLEKDVGEEDDLSNSMVEKAAALKKRLREWRDGVRAQMPVSNPDYRVD